MSDRLQPASNHFLDGALHTTVEGGARRASRACESGAPRASGSPRRGDLGYAAQPVFPAALIDHDLFRRRRISVVVAVLVASLALVETVNAIVAPHRAPSEKDWSAAAAKVRAGFRPGDLIVAAPAWADPVMRLQLGDLVPLPVAGRMDAARFGRIWEISQRGARAEDTADAAVSTTSRHGALIVKLWQKQAAAVTFDFFVEWRRAAMSVTTDGGQESPCAAARDRFQCSDGAALRPALLEIDTTLRNALGVEPREHATLALEYPDVPLGRELVVAAGLHNVWLRKSGDGKVRMRVLVDGRELGTVVATSSSGWALHRYDTAAVAGKVGKVRFEITTDKAHARHFAFAAEARNP
jgi:hypothetical protein